MHLWQTVNRPRGFTKQRKTGSASVSVTGAAVTFSKNTSTCKVKFNVSNEDLAGSSDDGGFSGFSFGRGFWF